jgi:hypothetical protein
MAVVYGIIGLGVGALAAAAIPAGGPHWPVIALSMGVFVLLGRLRPRAAHACGQPDEAAGFLNELARDRHELIGGVLLAYLIASLAGL